MTNVSQKKSNPTPYREGKESSNLYLILTNEEEMVNEINLLTGLGKSDHLVIDFSLIFDTKEESNVCSTDKLNFFRGNYNEIRHQLSLRNWHQELNGLNLLQSWQRFAELNINLIKNNIPVNKPNQEGNKNIPFLTRPCFDAMKTKRKVG